MGFPSKILLGVTGSISAYKAAVVARLLVKKGTEVQVVLTDGGAQFITPLTMATVSKKPVLSHFYQSDTGEWHNHVALAEWADLILIAPASANTLAKLANGFCDHLLHAIYLSAKSPVMVCPAMDHEMWHHVAVQRNVNTLKEDNVLVMPPASGELASGIMGDGRLPEPDDIVAFVEQKFTS